MGHTSPQLTALPQDPQPTGQLRDRVIEACTLLSGKGYTVTLRQPNLIFPPGGAEQPYDGYEIVFAAAGMDSPRMTILSHLNIEAILLEIEGMPSPAIVRGIPRLHLPPNARNRPRGMA